MKLAVVVPFVIAVVALPLMYVQMRVAHSNLIPSAGSVTVGGEPHDRLRQWNAPYHEVRRALEVRDEQFRAHTFYTIDCTFHQLYMGLGLESSWEDVGSEGFITRIVSGCLAAPEKLPLMKSFVTDPQRSGIFFSPTFTKLPNGDHYPPVNRPSSIWYWLNHTHLTEEVFILMDPDMIYLRPMPVFMVEKGKPAAQWYHYMQSLKWEQYNCSLCVAVEGEEEKRKYAVGPPWMLHVQDLKTIMEDWVALIPMIKAIDPGLWVTEMVAYSMAMAFHDLPHHVFEGAQVDDVGIDFNWYPRGTALEATFREEPVVTHYCYFWEVGRLTPPGSSDAALAFYKNISKEEDNTKLPVLDHFMFGKYRVPTDWPGGKAKYDQFFVSCDCPLLQEFHTPGYIPNDKLYQKRFATLMQVTIPRINQAMLKWKRKYCKAGKFNTKKLLRVEHYGAWVSKFELSPGKDNKTVEFTKV